MKKISLLINRLIDSKYLLIIILILAATLRFWHLGSVPPGLTPDEASLGYNTYSILKTGRDEFGTILPIVFKSFGDYKPGLYVYFDIPFVAILGLSEVSVRLPSVVSGILIVWLIYLICYVWFDKKIGYLAAFVAAINPYLIYFSRGAWEANVSLMLTLAGIYFFLKAIYKPRFLAYSAVLFTSTLLMYQGAKFSTSLVLLLLVLTNWKNFWKIKTKYLIKSVVLGGVISIPILLSLFNGQAYRLTIFSIFSYPRPASEIQTYAGPLFNIFHSDQLNYFRMIMSRWFNFYSGQFLFFAGDLANPVHTPPYQGVLLISDLVLLPLGFFALFKKRLTGGYLFILLWFLLAPFSAAISRDQTNAVRSLNASIPIVIIISFGLATITDRISKWKYKIPCYLLLATCYSFSIIYFLDSYFVHLPIHNSQYSRYGYKQVVEYLTTVESNYDHIFVEQSFNQPYIYFLFFQKYDPSKWQPQANLVNSQYIGDVGFETKLDKIEFQQIDWSKLRNLHNLLVVVDPNKIPPEIKNDSSKYPIIKEVKYLNNIYSAFDFVEIK
jgi:4-amino-4-deoxy-L-arabinose transferase-like glycosyltransferase